MTLVVEDLIWVKWSRQRYICGRWLSEIQRKNNNSLPSLRFLGITMQLVLALHVTTTTRQFGYIRALDHL